MSEELYGILAKEMSNISKSLGSLTRQIGSYGLNEGIQRNQAVMDLTEQIKIISSVNMAELVKSVQPIMNKEFLQNYNNVLASLKGYNFAEMSRILQTVVNRQNYSLARMTEAIQNAVNRSDWSQEVSVDELSERVAEQYIAEESKKQDETDSTKSRDKTYDRWNILKDIRDTISFLLTVIGFVMSFHSSKSYVCQNTYVIFLK